MTYSNAAGAAPGQDDDVWLHQAEQSERVIVTADKDFGELIFRRDVLEPRLRGVSPTALLLSRG